MTTAAEHFGGAISWDTAVNADIAWWEDRRVQRIGATVGGLTLSLPDLTTVDVPLGRFVFILRNSNANSVTIVDVNGQGISEVMAPAEILVCHTYMDGTTKKWLVEHRLKAF